MTGLHLVRKPRPGLPDRWYVYAWRGGPCIHTAEGARPVIGPELLARALAARQPARDHAGTIEGVIKDYRASPEYERLSDSTKKDYRLWLDRISTRWGDAPLAAFEDRRMRGEVIRWRDGWAAQPRTADKASGMMATVLGWAMERGQVAINVAARIPLLHQADKSDEVWEERHWQAVTALKPGKDDGEPVPQIPAHLLDALYMARYTGLRLGDLVRLTWEQVGEKSIVIDRTRKRKTRAVIPIFPELRAHLDARDWRSGTVLRNSRGQGWTESGLETVWQRTKPKDFDRVLHDLRGSFVTWLATKGLTDEEIARTIGWKARRIAEIRARYVDEARVIVSLVERLSA